MSRSPHHGRYQDEAGPGDGGNRTDRRQQGGYAKSVRLQLDAQSDKRVRYGEALPDQKMK